MVACDGLAYHPRWILTPNVTGICSGSITTLTRIQCFLMINTNNCRSQCINSSFQAKQCKNPLKQLHLAILITSQAWLITRIILFWIITITESGILVWITLSEVRRMRPWSVLEHCMFKICITPCRWKTVGLVLSLFKKMNEQTYIPEGTLCLCSRTVTASAEDRFKWQNFNINQARKENTFLHVYIRYIILFFWHDTAHNTEAGSWLVCIGTMCLKPPYCVCTLAYAKWYFKTFFDLLLTILAPKSRQDDFLQYTTPLM